MHTGDIKARFTLTNYGTNEAFTTEKGIRNTCYIYTVKYFFSHKKNESPLLCWKTVATEDDHFKAVKSTSARQIFLSFMGFLVSIDTQSHVYTYDMKAKLKLSRTTKGGGRIINGKGGHGWRVEGYEVECAGIKCKFTKSLKLLVLLSKIEKFSILPRT